MITFLTVVLYVLIFAGFLLLALVALPLGALLVVLPFVALSVHWERHRLLSAARQQPCPVCGQIIGTDAVDRADQIWRNHVAQLHRDNPGARLRLLRFLDAACGRCGAQLRFHRHSGKFTLLDRSLRTNHSRPVPDDAGGANAC